MPDGALLIVPPPSDPDTAESVSVGGAANCAVTAAVAPVIIVTVQVLPLQAPVYPENEARPDGVAVNVTTVVAGKVVVQVPPVAPAVITQLIPDGELVTTPLPVPPPLIVIPCVLKIASAMRGCDMPS